MLVSQEYRCPVSCQSLPALACKHSWAGNFPRHQDIVTPEECLLPARSSGVGQVSGVCNT